MSETHMSARKGVPAPPSLYKRKAAAYQQLNAALADPTNKYSFETILSVNAALFVEARIVGPEITRMHLKALDQLYVARNRRFAEDRDSFAALLRLSVYTAWLMCECEAASHAQLQNTVRTSLTRFENMQKWMSNLQEQIRNDGLQAVPDNKLRKFQSSKHRLLQHRAIKSLIAKPPAYIGYSHIASHFSVLLLLNLSLYELGQEVGTFFLDRMLLIIDNSMDVDRSGKSLLKLPALPMMMAQARLDVLHTYTRQELGYDEEVVDESLETRNSMIDALKLFSYLGDDSRKRLIVLLFAWLTNDLGRHDSFSGTFSHELEEEVNHNWLHQQKTSRTPSRASQ